jgi:hypothetical protein
MDTFDTFVALWVLLILLIISFQAYALRQLTKMREEE